MLIKSLAITGLRNLDEVHINLGAQLNYIFGENGAGKTALLEGICLLSQGRSFRTPNVKNVIATTTNELVVRAEIDHPNHQLALSKAKSGLTRVRIDGHQSSKVSDLARLMPVQVLLPTASELIFEGPSKRRRYLDWGLFHVKQTYLGQMRDYRKLLLQRSAWLKQQVSETGLSPEEDPWWQQLCEIATALGIEREDYVHALSKHFIEALASLAPTLSVELAYDWGGLISAENVVKKFSESFPRDVKFGSTHRGPHRADLLLNVNGQLAGDVLSRGQGKVVASALVLAQAALQKQLTGVGGVVLIDDFGAELDKAHWHRFLEALQDNDCQIIATSTEQPDDQWLALVGVEKCELFHVKQGMIEAWSNSAA